jgi:hypothetical protein
MNTYTCYVYFCKIYIRKNYILGCRNKQIHDNNELLFYPQKMSFLYSSNFYHLYTVIATKLRQSLPP